ncbi:MAG: isoleucine--tRNA ligase [Cystobacterineae bacterium]|nr:isoleucine--tRNA ligase [Cystobacterineae bacterium]
MSVDYKATLNLPKTAFPMKGNLPNMEPKILAFWEERRIFEKQLQKNLGRPVFCLHDGPPYANGELHAGHALNKILKDIIIKFRNLSGGFSEYVPGWDCHGLPIERAVEKRLAAKKKKRQDMTRGEFLEACRTYAMEYVNIQREGFRRMGIGGHWDKPYLTLQFAYEAEEIRQLAAFAKQGLLYRKKKPVFWCIHDQTALAEAEVEYADHTSTSVYVAFEVTAHQETLPLRADKPLALAIWTTTPWTLPANLAICAHPTLDYGLYALGDQQLVLAEGLLCAFLAAVAPGELKAGVKAQPGVFRPEDLAFPEKWQGGLKGEMLSKLRYRHVFYDRESPVILGKHVSLEAGTGLVHTAPGHGQEDFEVGLEYALEIYNPVLDDGRFDATVGERLQGLKVTQADEVVVDWLVEKGVLLNKKGDKLSHSYPHCWRCRHPIVFRATHQWFIDIDANGLRQKALQHIENTIQWMPAWGKGRIHGMVSSRPDWCISRQRTWGVPVAVPLCEDCQTPVIDEALMLRVADMVEKEGVAVWYSTPMASLLPEGFVCKTCGGKRFKPETDILDVWFDSGCSFASLGRMGLPFPAQLYLEGSDQHRGWFQSSLLVSVGARGVPPFESCLTHGFILDGEGKKMSKSLGNGIEPEEVFKKYGAEILRLWVASSDYRDDISLSMGVLDGLSENYRKVRNTLRYALSNLYDFSPLTHAVDVQQLALLDKWALTRLAQVLTRVKAAFEAYEFHHAFRALVDFCTTDLSAVYFDILKDSLYTLPKNSPKRRSAQTALWHIAKDLLVAFAPLTSFTSEEAWQHLPGENPESVFLAEFPTPKPLLDEGLRQEFAELLALRSAVLPLLEAQRREGHIGKSIDARVLLWAEGARRTLLEKHWALLPEIFIVSQVQWASEEAAKEATPLSVGGKAKVALAQGGRCPRCWIYFEEIKEEGNLCARCQAATQNQK